MKIALCSREKFSLKRVSEIVKKYCQSVDLFILPEVFDTGFDINQFSCINGEQTIFELQKITSEYNSAICGSVYLKNNRENKLSNSFFFIDQDKPAFICKKHHLFGPFEKQFADNTETYKTFVFKEFKIRPLICYDLRFPVWCRNTDNYDLIINVSQWPLKRLHDLRVLLAARALENSAYCINVNGLGCSSVFDFGGNKVFEMNETDEIGFFEIDKNLSDEYRTKRPYFADADKFELL